MVRRKISIYLYLLICLLWAPEGHSTEHGQKYTGRQWDNTTGLPINSIMDFDFDGFGYLWGASEEGLVRFNGTTFKVYNQSNLSGLLSPKIKKIAKSKKGGVWASTFHNIIYAYRGNVEVYDLTDSLNSAKITEIEEGEDNQLWVGTDQGSLFAFDNGTLTKIGHWPKFSGGVIQVIEPMPGGVALGTTDGLYQYSSDSGTIRSVPTLSGINVRSIEHHKGELWVGTFGEGIFTRTDQWKQLTMTDRLASNHVNEIYHEAGNDQIWIGHSVGGVQFMHDGHIHDLPENEFNYNEIREIRRAKDGSIWFAALGHGIIQMIPATIRNLTKKDGLSMDIMLAIYQDKDSTVYAGTVGNGVNIIDQKGIQHLTTDDGLRHGIIGSIWGDDRYMYFGTANGLHIYDKESQSIIQVLGMEDGLANNLIHSVFQDQSKRIWVGTRNGGIHHLSIMNGEFQIKQLKVPEGYENAQFMSFHEDSKGNIWTSTVNNGVVKIAPDLKMTSIPYLTDPSNISVLTFWEDPEGTVWAGSIGGLVAFYNDELIVLSKEKGLAFNETFGLISDDQGYLWASGNYGIQQIRIKDLLAFKKNPTKELSVRLFNEIDGMLNRETNGGVFPAGWKLQNGEIWFPSMKGIVIIDPPAIHEKESQIQTFIESVSYAGTEYSPSKDGAIAIPAGITNFQVTFTAIEFTHPENLQYAYRLKNVSDDWIKIQDNPQVHFSGLAPGNYTIEAKSTLFGNESEITSMRFDIEPFFYETMWFKFLIISGVALAGLVFWSIASNRKIASELRKRVAEQTKELMANNIQLKKTLEDLKKQNNLLTDVTWSHSHELRAPLARILALNDVLQRYNNLKRMDKTKEELIEELNHSAIELDLLLRNLNDRIDKIKSE